MVNVPMGLATDSIFTGTTCTYFCKMQAGAHANDESAADEFPPKNHVRDNNRRSAWFLWKVWRMKFRCHFRITKVS